MFKETETKLSRLSKTSLKTATVSENSTPLLYFIFLHYFIFLGAFDAQTHHPVNASFTHFCEIWKSCTIDPGGVQTLEFNHTGLKLFLSISILSPGAVLEICLGEISQELYNP